MIEPAHLVVLDERPCHQCTWRSPGRVSAQCDGCYDARDKPHYEFDSCAAWGTRAVEEAIAEAIARAVDDFAERRLREGKTRLDGRWLRVMRRLASKHPTRAHQNVTGHCTSERSC